jgi:hypothetical protein
MPYSIPVLKSFAVTPAPSINDSKEQSLLRTQIQVLELNVARKQHTIKEKVGVGKNNKVQLQDKERKIEVLQEKVDAENDKATTLSEQELRTLKALNNTVISL